MWKRVGVWTFKAGEKSDRKKCQNRLNQLQEKLKNQAYVMSLIIHSKKINTKYLSPSKWCFKGGQYRRGNDHYLAWARIVCNHQVQVFYLTKIWCWRPSSVQVQSDDAYDRGIGESENRMLVHHCGAWFENTYGHAASKEESASK